MSEYERLKHKQMRDVLELLANPDALEAHRRRLRAQDEAMERLSRLPEAKVPSPTIDDQIINRLYEALEVIGAPVDLLQIVGSWADTMPKEEILRQLQAFIEELREEAR